jgi:hypothetical protein
MHKIVHGKKLLSFSFSIATAFLCMLFASFSSVKITGTPIKQVQCTSVNNINPSKNIKRTTNKQAEKLVKSDIRKQMVIVT